jgi:hypothetical protein
MMEIVMLAEDVFPITIANEELRALRTVGDVQRFIECKLRGLPSPAALTSCTCASANASMSANAATSTANSNAPITTATEPAPAAG